MNFIKTKLDGVVIVEPKVFEDERGYFFESYNEYHKESEFGIRYDDPEIDVNWQVPANKVITSQKDRLANKLKDILTHER